MIVTFDRALIARLLAHAEAASERRATLTQLFDKSLRKPGHGARMGPSGRRRSCKDPCGSVAGWRSRDLHDVERASPSAVR
ncbi:hypothetical protein [Gluconobacter thailandicus]|uniref:hypothetical protein n=1 Tax=Gluconobacter thailandicus TaxID=257438 RepID=UPI001F15BEBB|nr:hypothetical protein [Gluconobacter thailandicus]